jgi:hypothetical protein
VESKSPGLAFRFGQPSKTTFHIISDAPGFSSPTLGKDLSALTLDLSPDDIKLLLCGLSLYLKVAALFKCIEDINP